MFGPSDDSIDTDDECPMMRVNTECIMTNTSLVECNDDGRAAFSVYRRHVAAAPRVPAGGKA